LYPTWGTVACMRQKQIIETALDYVFDNALEAALAAAKYLAIVAMCQPLEQLVDRYHHNPRSLFADCFNKLNMQSQSGEFLASLREEFFHWQRVTLQVASQVVRHGATLTVRNIVDAFRRRGQFQNLAS